jgi:hypothetical protein
MGELQDLRNIAKARLDVEEIVRNAEIVRTGRTLRRSFELALMLSFLFLGLHSAGRIQLPPEAITTVSCSIPLSIMGLLSEHVQLIWRSRRR